MSRSLSRGGAWRNTEDEILKVAVMKYGKNEWARVASLLHQKTAKQCKARWYEWLDPSIKKTDWSREEDEKLLHLAKLMPTQWRTIAPIVGRTSAQCLERYEFLLDRAQEITESGGDISDIRDSSAGTGKFVSGGADPRKNLPGEFFTNPEIRPALPDPVDMDDDELEMLSEARARLANTQGKKAKRKAREKQLGEAKRLAEIQKRKELAAAGIDDYQPMDRVKMRTFIDYNKEVPFERVPMAGFYDTSAEVVSEFDQDLVRTNQKIAYKDSNLEEAMARAKDKEKFEQKQKTDPVGAYMQLHGIKNLEETAAENIVRHKIELPFPKVLDSELVGLRKLNSISRLVSEGGDLINSGFDSSMLLTDYDDFDVVKSALKNDDADNELVEESDLVSQANDLRMLNTLQTPLLGGVMETPRRLLNDFSVQSSVRNENRSETDYFDKSSFATVNKGSRNSEYKRICDMVKSIKYPETIVVNEDVNDEIEVDVKKVDESKQVVDESFKDEVEKVNFRKRQNSFLPSVLFRESGLIAGFDCLEGLNKNDNQIENMINEQIRMMVGETFSEENKNVVEAYLKMKNDVNKKFFKAYIKEGYEKSGSFNFYKNSIKNLDKALELVKIECQSASFDDSKKIKPQNNTVNNTYMSEVFDRKSTKYNETNEKIEKNCERLKKLLEQHRRLSTDLHMYEMFERDEKIILERRKKENSINMAKFQEEYNRRQREYNQKM